ncbi:MAG: hypothetical protein V2B18_21430 [Pseudomonadota bacterium]
MNTGDRPISHGFLRQGAAWGLPTVGKLTLICIIAWCCMAAAPEKNPASKDPFTRYKDPGGRFSFEYPNTMTPRNSDPDEVTLFHPKAGLRISVFVEKRRTKGPAQVKPLIEALKKGTGEDGKSVEVLKEGKLPGWSDAQGYVVCTFKARKDLELVQMIQYYVSGTHILQMIVSDRPEGFKNLVQVIERIHRSLRVVEGKI